MASLAHIPVFFLLRNVEGSHTRNAAEMPTSCLWLDVEELSAAFTFKRLAQNSSALMTWLPVSLRKQVIRSHSHVFHHMYQPLSFCPFLPFLWSNFRFCPICRQRDVAASFSWIHAPPMPSTGLLLSNLLRIYSIFWKYLLWPCTFLQLWPQPPVTIIAKENCLLIPSSSSVLNTFFFLNSHS